MDMNVLKAASVAVLIGVGSVAIAGTDADKPTTHGLTKASAWIGKDVEDKAGNNVGEVKDLVVDWQTGKVSYAIVSIEKWLHVGSKLVAIEPKQLQVTPDGQHVVVAMTEAEVQAMPGIDDRNLPLASTKNSQQSPHSQSDMRNDSDSTKRTY